MEKDKSESYLHYEAKKRLLDWIRKNKSVTENIDDMSWCGLKWRTNRGAPDYGIYEEYPIAEDFNGCEVWDERGWKTGKHPNYEWMKREYKKSFRIPDIVITHKGSIAHIIEISHKNPLSEDKIKFYKMALSCVKIIEIPAKWILDRTSEPKSIPEEFFK